MNAFQKRESSVYDVAKSITVLLVVIAHATRMYTPLGVIHPLNQSVLLENVTQYIYAFHMPLFVFLTGCVYAFCIDRGKYTNMGHFILNKAKRLLIPYFVTGVAVVAPTMVLLGLSDMSYLQYCYEGILLSLNSRHLWYLLAVFWMFALAMFVRPFLVKSRFYRFLLFAISVVLYLITWKISFLPKILQLRTTFTYLIYFFAGVIFKYEYDIFAKLSKRFSFIYFILPIAFVSIYWLDTNGITNKLYSFLGILMIIGLSFCIVQRSNKLLDTRWYRFIKRNSMGIYLFHPMIIYILFYFLGEYDIHPYLLCCGIIVISLFASGFLSELLRKLNLKFIIGEKTP